ncbi:hypothetical protein HK096_001117, partial [Nowakowskiella sp. JEL0078]
MSEEIFADIIGNEEIDPENEETSASNSSGRFRNSTELNANLPVVSTVSEPISILKPVQYARPMREKLVSEQSRTPLKLPLKPILLASDLQKE